MREPNKGQFTNLPYLPSDIWSHVVTTGGLSVNDAKNLRLVCKDIAIVPSCIPIPLTFSIDTMCAEGHFQAMKWVLSDVNSAFFLSSRCIDSAATNGRLDILHWIFYDFLEKEHNRVQKEKLFTNVNIQAAIERAAETGHVEVIDWLISISTSTEVLITDNVPVKALENASEAGNLKAFVWIADRYKVCQPFPLSCLYKAIANGHLDCSKWLYQRIDVALLKHASNIDQDLWYHTDLAIAYGHYEVYNWLCEMGLSSFQRWATVASRYGIYDILDDILNKCPDVDISRLLDVSIMYGQYETVRRLHKRSGIEINESHIVCCNRYYMSTNLLIWIIKRFAEGKKKEREKESERNRNASNPKRDQDSKVMSQETVDHIVCDLISSTGDIDAIHWYKRYRDASNVPSSSPTSSSFTPASSYSPSSSENSYPGEYKFRFPSQAIINALSLGHVWFIRYLFEVLGIDEFTINFELYILIDFIIPLCDTNALDYWLSLCERNGKRALYTSNAVDSAAKFGRVDNIEWIFNNAESLCLVANPVENFGWNEDILVWNVEGGGVEAEGGGQGEGEGEGGGEGDGEEGGEENAGEEQADLAVQQEHGNEPFQQGGIAPVDNIVIDVIIQPIVFPQDTTPSNLPYTNRAMDNAAHNGHVHVLEYLQSRLGEQALCSKKAMDNAASRGHHRVVQWLHLNRTEGCTHEAILRAQQNGHSDMVQWLMIYRPDAL